MQDEASVHIIYCVVSVLKASEIDFDHVTCERQLNCTFLFPRKTGGKFVSLIFIPSCNAALRNVTQDTKEGKKSSLHFKLVASKFFQEDEASKWFIYVLSRLFWKCTVVSHSWDCSHSTESTVPLRSRKLPRKTPENWKKSHHNNNMKEESVAMLCIEQSWSGTSRVDL